VARREQGGGLDAAQPDSALGGAESMGDNGSPLRAFYERNRTVLKPEALFIYFGLLVLGWLLTLVLARIPQYGTKALGLVSFGSSWIKNSIYRLAASDPSQYGTVFSAMAAGLALLVAYFMLFNVIRARIPPRKRSKEERAKYITAQRRRQVRVAVLGLGSVLAIIYMQFQLSIASTLWASFHRNLAIAAPYISEHERLTLESQFRLMESEADWGVLNQRLFELGKKSGIPIKAAP
jgi:hypothetical protein